MKLKHVVITVFMVLFLDQLLKIYIKTNFSYGQEVNVIGNWFRLHFIENEGMAFGMKFGEHWGKVFLTLFRLVAVCWGFYFIQNTLIKQKYSNGLIFCSSLILAGAMGNLIDSLFYGKIFTESFSHSSMDHKSQFVAWGHGYGDLLHGKVVDMLYFPLFSGVFPSWVPFWGGQPFEFFRPVFNLADFSISFGVITILVFQNSLLHRKWEKESQNRSVITEETKEQNDIPENLLGPNLSEEPLT